MNLLNAADENVALSEEIRQLKVDIKRLGYNNRRLEETASILAKGNRELAANNQQLTRENNERFAKLEEVTRFEAERDRAREDLEQTEIELASIRNERDQLRRDLQMSNANIERFIPPESVHVSKELCKPGQLTEIRSFALPPAKPSAWAAKIY